jgi:hypothetical protein
MTEIQNQHHEKWWRRFTTLAEIQTIDSTVERKGQMLALYIVLLFGLSAYTIINDLFMLFVFKDPEYV